MTIHISEYTHASHYTVYNVITYRDACLSLIVITMFPFVIEL